MSSVARSAAGAVTAVGLAAVVAPVAVTGAAVAAVARGAIPVVVGAEPAEVAACTMGGPRPGGGSGGAIPGGGAVFAGAGAGADDVAVADDCVEVEVKADEEVVSEIGFFLGEAWVLDGGFVDWVESDDFPRDMAAAAADVDFFLSDDLADPIGKTEGEGKGNAALVLPGVGLRETIFPILRDLGPPLIVLAGKVLTVMFFPHPAELGRADAISVSRMFAVA